MNLMKSLSHIPRFVLAAASLALAVILVTSGDQPDVHSLDDKPVRTAKTLETVSEVRGKPVTTVQRPGSAPAKAMAGQVVVQADPSAADRLGQASSVGPNLYLVSVDQNADLDTLADFLVEAGQITEKERFEVPVLSRRAIWVMGENSVGRSGVGTFWTPNGYVILANLGGPDEATISDLMFTWGFTVGSMKPLQAETLGEGMLASDVSQFTINYPEGWTADTDVVVFEIQEEMSSDVSSLKGIFLSVIDAPLTEIGFEPDATLEAISTSMGGSFGLDETATDEEFVFLDQPAIVSWGEIDDGSGGKRGLILTSSIVGENAVVFVLIAPSLERAEEFMPTWVAMMQSVTSTATE